MRTIILLMVFYLPVHLYAQGKDSLQLSCPLNEAREAPVNVKAHELGVDQNKLILLSASDTTVKACISGTVNIVVKDENGKWDLMFHNQNHYFWYSGLSRVVVVKGQKLERGQAVGILKTGEKMELMMYDFETPVDPKKYVECR